MMPAAATRAPASVKRRQASNTGLLHREARRGRSTEHRTAQKILVRAYLTEAVYHSHTKESGEVPDEVTSQAALDARRGRRSRFHPPLAQNLLACQPFHHSLSDELADFLQLLEGGTLSRLGVGRERLFFGGARTIRTIRTYFSSSLANTNFPSVYMVFWS